MTKKLLKRLLSMVLCAGCVFGVLPAAAGEEDGTAQLQATQKEPTHTVKQVDGKAVDENDKPIDIKLDEHTFVFSTVPQSYSDIIQYKLDSPYKAMALMILAYRTWTPQNEKDCLQMLDYLTDTGATVSGSDSSCPFSQYNPWISALKDRMTQNDKYRYIGNAYLSGATAKNNYTPTTPITVKVRESAYVPYAKASDLSPELYQVLISIDGADNDRYCLFFKDSNGSWKVYQRSWINLLADIKTPEMDQVLPPETGPLPSKLTQKEPKLKIDTLPAKAPGVDENGSAIIIDTTVEQYTYTFSTVPTCYNDIIQYKLDSPYKTMALYFLALRTWTPDNETDCLQMLDYLTNTNVASGKTDSDGRKLSTKFSEYKYWTDFVRDRMKQNTKYRYIGNAYLGGASPANDYTPTTPITVTVRQSVYDPYSAAVDGGSPELKQVLIHIDGADNDRYGLLYQDQRGDWRFFSDFWKGLLADVQKPHSDYLYPPETVVSAHPAHPQVEPTETVYDIPARAPAVDDKGNSIVLDTTVKQHTFTFTTVPTCYEDIVQYKLDSPYKAMALLILAYRTWTPDNPTDCLQMMDYLTNTAVDSGKKDSEGHKLSKKTSEYQFWTDFVRDRMRQNEKYRYIGNAYLDGAMPANDYTPNEPITITVRESVYNPYKASGTTEADPALYQVLTTIPGADNDRYSIFYQDQRGDWRVWSDNWKGLLTDVKTPGSDIPYPAEVVRSSSPANVQKEPKVSVKKIPAKAAGVDKYGSPIVIDTEVDEYTFTFSTVPTCYEDIVQYKLDSPYKTMALMILAYRTWDPEDPETCAHMLDYLTNTAVENPGVKDAQGHQLCKAFSEYTPWLQFIQDRMMQNEKYRYIGDAYLGGASPSNNYTPNKPITITVRQSTYDPYKAATDTYPEQKQVLISLDGADNDRYSVFYQDQRGDWRVFGDLWKGLLTDVKMPVGDMIWPAEKTSVTTQKDLADTVKNVAAKIPSGDGVEDTTVEQHTIKFSALPASAKEVAQYKADSPYKALALFFAAIRTWKPDDPSVCLKMLDELTFTNAEKKGAKDSAGNKIAYKFSEYEPWKQFLTDRMKQGGKYAYIGRAYFDGATPQNGYTPSGNTVTLRQSVYDPYSQSGAYTPELKQVLVKIAGMENERYCLMFQDPRGDWRIWSDSWKGLLTDVFTIENAQLTKDNKVTFEAENAEKYAEPLVIEYDAKGRMVGVTKANLKNGKYEAKVSSATKKYTIVLPSKGTKTSSGFTPLCESEVLNRN